MKSIALILVVFVGMVLPHIPGIPDLNAAACDGIAFSQGACYSQAIVAKQVVPHYEQIVLPLNQYAYSQPQAIVLPQKVQIVRPETVLRLEQVHGYQQPLVLKQQVGHAQAVVVQKQVQRHGLRQRFLGSRSRSFNLSITRQRN